MSEIKEVQEIKEYIEELFDSYFVKDKMPAYIDFYEYKKYMLPMIYRNFIASMRFQMDYIGVYDVYYDIEDVIFRSISWATQECIEIVCPDCDFSSIVPRKVLESCKDLYDESFFDMYL